MVPEALISTYHTNYSNDQIERIISNELEWASCIVIGPGMSKSEIAVTLTKYVIGKTRVPTIIDADALNIMADIMLDAKTDAKSDAKSDAELDAKTDAKADPKIDAKTGVGIETGIDDNVFSSVEGAVFILTPHIGEMERISGFDKGTIKSNPIKYADEFVKSFSKNYSQNLEIICVMKDARTIVTDVNGCTYINTSGNSGMAKGGSGDVLTGVIAGLISNKMSCFDAACMGVYVHGLAGDESAFKKGQYGMKAGDIIDNICTVMK